jgi:hypothetical protein
MSHGPTQAGEVWYFWGQEAAAGDGLVLEETGEELNGLPLFRIVPGAGTGGHWTIVANGDPENPDLVYYEGDVIDYFVTE